MSVQQTTSGSHGLDETPKSYRTILELEVSAGLSELNRPTAGLLASGFSAGLDIGFSALAVGLVVTLTEGRLSDPVFELFRANAYAVGFIFVIFGRSELFTEHTTLAVLPILDGQESLRQLGRLWGLIYVANVSGTWIFGSFLSVIGPALGVVEIHALSRIADDLVHHAWWVILFSGVLAGWMMGLASWLVKAGRDTIGQIFFVWLVTALIGFAHLHHCIVGSAELAAAWLALEHIHLADYGYVLLFSTLGNALGGTFFVAVIKYAHARVIYDDRRFGIARGDSSHGSSPNKFGFFRNSGR